MVSPIARNIGMTLPAEDITPEFLEQQTREQRARITDVMPSAKEIKKMPKKAARNLKEALAARTARSQSTLEQLFSNLDTEIKTIQDEIDAIEQTNEQIDIDLATSIAAAEAAEAEANTAVTAVTQYGIDAGTTQYTELPDWIKTLINQQPQYKTVSNAGIAAAIAALQAVGVEGLTSVMEEIRKLYPDISSEDALMLLKYDKRFNNPYLTRFAGNKMLMDAGFAPMDDKEYLATEKAFDKIFTSYGLKQFNTRDRFGKLIGSRISADELAARVSTAYDRVIKGAAETRNAITQLYPELTNADLVAYAIDPVNQLPALQRKVQAAEIGGAALAQNLSIGLQAAPTGTTGFTNVQRTGMGVEQLMEQGVDLETARRGFANVAEVLPTAEKLSALYGARMDQYGRLQAEQEQFQGLASAKRARERLTAEEEAQFRGSAGRARITRDIGGAI